MRAYLSEEMRLASWLPAGIAPWEAWGVRLDLRAGLLKAPL